MAAPIKRCLGSALSSAFIYSQNPVTYILYDIAVLALFSAREGGFYPKREGKVSRKNFSTLQHTLKYKWRKGGRPCVSFSISLYLSLEVLAVDILWPRWVARIGVGDVIHAGVFSDGRPSVHGPFSDGPGYSSSSRTGFPGSSGVTPSPPET